MNMYIRIAALSVAASIAAPAAADVSGAYGRANPDGSVTTYIVVVQKGDTILATLNALAVPVPSFTGGASSTNVVSYGIAPLDPANRTASVRVTNYNGACYSDQRWQFTGTSIVRTGLGGTCTPSTFSDTFTLAF